jgi:hypothetical protein
MLPNEEFGRRNKRGNADFEGSTFQWIIAQIEYSHPLKVLPSKSAFPLLFLLPKSNEDSGRPNKPEWRTKNCAISQPLLNEGK